MRRKRFPLKRTAESEKSFRCTSEKEAFARVERELEENEEEIGMIRDVLDSIFGNPTNLIRSPK